MTQWLLSNVARWILICIYRCKTANKTLKTLRGFISQNPWHPFAESWSSKEPSLRNTGLNQSLCHRLIAHSDEGNQRILMRWSKTQIRRVYNEKNLDSLKLFRHKCDILENNPRCGLLSNAWNNKQLQKFVNVGQKFSNGPEIDDQLHVHQETVCQIHCEHFGGGKCVKFGPHSLMDYQKRAQSDNSRTLHADPVEISHSLDSPHLI